jgi:hypothetical protein
VRERGRERVKYGVKVGNSDREKETLKNKTIDDLK